MELTYDTYEPEHYTSDVPVLMLHAVIENRNTWNAIAQDISTLTGRKVYTLDFRNHGDSPWNDVADSTASKKDVVKFMDDHGISRTSFVGHSLGGLIAMFIALEMPERVEKVVVEEMLMEYGWKQKRAALMVVNLMKRSLTAIPPGSNEDVAKKAVFEYLRKYSPDKGSNKGFFNNEDIVQLRKIRGRYEWKMNMRVIEVEVRNTIPLQFSGIFDGQILFLCGTASSFDITKDDSLPRYFPNYVMEHFEGGGHTLHQDFPSKYLETVTKFIGTMTDEIRCSKLKNEIE